MGESESRKKKKKERIRGKEARGQFREAGVDSLKEWSRAQRELPQSQSRKKGGKLRQNTARAKKNT